MSRQFLSQIMPSIRGSVAVSAIVMFSFIPLSGCELTQNHSKIDREKDMAVQDYRDALAPRLPEIDETASDTSSIPPLQPYVAQPGSNSKVMPLVSISVNQTIPLRDVLYEVADQANYDVEIDPRIRGAIIFSAKNRPLDVVIERISEIAGLRFSFEDDIMRVEIDTPYHKTYKVNYLALKRDNASSISNDISIVSGEGSDTGSNFSAVNESSIDFWAELETNLTQILESNRDANSLLTSKDPRISAVQENPAPVTPIIMDEEGNITENGPNVQVQAPNTVLRVENLEEDEDAVADSGEEDPFAARFSLNKQAGMISVFAPERLHKRVDEYMKDLKKSVSAQVLIEAKVLEVSLSDEFSAGINWAAIDLFEGSTLGFGLGSGAVRGVLTPAPSPPSDFGFNYNGNDFTAAVDALSRFGTVHALASPRLTVLNNQSAALNVAKNVVYFEIEAETTSSDSGIVTTFETDAKTVPEGVLINVQPAIDLDRRTVSMAVRPTVTNIVDFENDPNPELVGINPTALNPNGTTVVSQVPVVNVQEFDSIIQVNSGQAVVLGGLIQDRVSSTQNGVPVLSEMPLFGAAFRNQQDQITKTELVVFLKATIVDGNNTIHDTDRDLYRTFSQDRRPIKF